MSWPLREVRCLCLLRDTQATHYLGRSAFTLSVAVQGLRFRTLGELIIAHSPPRPFHSRCNKTY
jgi:hypothetical protein